MLHLRFFLIFFLASFLPRVWAESDGQVWSSLTFNLFKKTAHSLSFYAEGRFRDNASEGYGYFFGPIYRYKASPRITLGLGAKMIHFKGGSGFSKLHRIEAETNIKFKDTGKWRFDNRTRYEYINREVGAAYNRWRARFRMNWKANRPGVIKGYFVSNEAFHRSEFGGISQNRLVPFGMTWKLSEKLSFDTYLMYHYVHRSSENNYVLGISLML